jgi:adenylosuccinate lyase
MESTGTDYFRFKMALWYQDITRHMERLKRAKEEISYGKISGAMGTCPSGSDG